MVLPAWDSRLGLDRFVIVIGWDGFLSVVGELAGGDLVPGEFDGLDELTVDVVTSVARKPALHL